MKNKDKKTNLPYLRDSHLCGVENTKAGSSCVTCTLKCNSLLFDLSIPELEKLNFQRYIQNYNAGDTIYKSGDTPIGLLCLREGKIKISKTGDSGKEIIVGLMKPVDFLSSKALIMGETYSNTAIAIEDSSICVISKESFFSVLKDNPVFSLRLINFFAKKLDDSENRMINLTNKHMLARLAEVLLLVHDVYGVDKDNTLNANLKRSELAALANMIPSNAIRVLSGFAKENVIKTNRQKITILNMEALIEISKYGYTLKK